MTQYCYMLLWTWFKGYSKFFLHFYLLLYNLNIKQAYFSRVLSVNFLLELNQQPLSWLLIKTLMNILPWVMSSSLWLRCYLTSVAVGPPVRLHPFVQFWCELLRGHHVWFFCLYFLHFYLFAITSITQQGVRLFICIYANMYCWFQGFWLLNWLLVSATTWIDVLHQAISPWVLT
jgi:hypothetical protein